LDYTEGGLIKQLKKTMINLMSEKNNHRYRSMYLVKSFEAHASKKRPFSIKVADFLTSQFGTIFFLSLNVGFFTVWIILNIGIIKEVPIFDPFPFILLITFVSLEAIILSIIVLISQKRENQINTLRQELQYQVNLITEREINKALKLLKDIIEKDQKGKLKDKELDEMIKGVDTSYIERKLEEEIKATENPFDILKK
jgi:uncharacterized membrane protein